MKGAQIRDNFAAAFYAELFRRYPETNVLFEQRHTNMQRQQKALMQALETVLEALHAGQTERLSATLVQLGTSHRAYGVQPTDYAKVGTVLLDTLADFAPPDPSTASADWTTAYGTVVALMEPATARGLTEAL